MEEVYRENDKKTKKKEVRETDRDKNYEIITTYLDYRIIKIEIRIANCATLCVRG